MGVSWGFNGIPWMGDFMGISCGFHGYFRGDSMRISRFGLLCDLASSNRMNIQKSGTVWKIGLNIAQASDSSRIIMGASRMEGTDEKLPKLMSTPD